MYVSAPAGPIDWTSAIDGAAARRFAVFADRLISHRCYDTRPKNDARSRDATRGIIDVLTVHDRRTCTLCICRGRQNKDCKKGKQCCHIFHAQLHLFVKLLQVILSHLLIWLKKYNFSNSVCPLSTTGGKADAEYCKMFAFGSCQSCVFIDELALDRLVLGAPDFARTPLRSC
jgi:hypothetical protein